jgi:hypothetical protein
LNVSIATNVKVLDYLVELPLPERELELLLELTSELFSSQLAILLLIECLKDLLEDFFLFHRDVPTSHVSDHELLKLELGLEVAAVHKYLVHDVFL